MRPIISGKGWISIYRILSIILTITIIPLNTFAESATKLPFKVGERLKFKIYFEFVLGGEARMEVEGVEKIDGHDCLRIVSEAKSTRTVDNFYKVRDKISSWRDIKSGFSRLYTKTTREGKYKDDKKVEYFPEKNRLVLTRKADALPETLELDQPVYDVLAAFYQVRLLNLEVGKSVFIEMHDIDKRYPLEVKVIGLEHVEVPAGNFDCVVIEPMLQSSGIFRKEGSLQIWLTDDEYHMPVLMKSKLYFGRVWAKLSDYKRGGE